METDQISITLYNLRSKANTLKRIKQFCICRMINKIGIHEKVFCVSWIFYQCDLIHESRFSMFWLVGDCPKTIMLTVFRFVEERTLVTTQSYIQSCVKNVYNRELQI